MCVCVCVCVCVCFQDMIIGIILQIEYYLCHLSLLHILTNENSGNNYSHSFEDSFEVLTKHFFYFHFVFGVSNIMVWLLPLCCRGNCEKAGQVSLPP